MAVKKTFEFFFRPLLKKFFQDMGRDPNNLEMILLRQKAGQLFKDSNKVINFPQKRSFKEEIEAMKKSGDIVDEKDMVVSEKITDREMFKNSNLNKPTEEITEDTGEGFIDFVRRTDPKGADKLQKVEDEIKAAIEAGNKRAVENLKKKNKKKKEDDPDDMATGGRAGFAEGGGIESRLEQLGGDVTSAEQLLQQINERLESAGSSVPEGGGISHDQFVNTPAVPAGGLGTLAPGVPTGLNRIPEGAPTTPHPNLLRPGATAQPVNFFNADLPNKLTPIDPYRNTQLAGLSQDGQRFDSAQGAFDALADYTKKQREANPYTRNMIGTEMYQGDKGFENFTNYFNQVNDPSYTAPSPQLVASSQQNLQKALPGLFAKGGRAGFYTGGITDVEPSLDDIGHGSDSLMARTRLVSPNSQATTTSTGLNYLLAEDNDNIRVPFAAGGDAGRRAFLKLLASLTGGAAAVKSGI
jgi:hypothetical protein